MWPQHRKCCTHFYVCPNYHRQRDILHDKVIPLAPFNLHTLLHGIEEKPQGINVRVINAVHEYITNTCGFFWFIKGTCYMLYKFPKMIVTELYWQVCVSNHLFCPKWTYSLYCCQIRNKNMFKPTGMSTWYNQWIIYWGWNK